MWVLSTVSRQAFSHGHLGIYARVYKAQIVNPGFLLEEKLSNF